MENSLYAVWKSNTGTNKGEGHPDIDLAIFPRSGHAAIPELFQWRTVSSSDWTSVDLSVSGHQQF